MTSIDSLLAAASAKTKTPPANQIQPEGKGAKAALTFLDDLLLAAEGEIEAEIASLTDSADATDDTVKSLTLPETALRFAPGTAPLVEDSGKALLAKDVAGNTPAAEPATEEALALSEAEEGAEENESALPDALMDASDAAVLAAPVVVSAGANTATAAAMADPATPQPATAQQLAAAGTDAAAAQQAPAAEQGKAAPTQASTPASTTATAATMLSGESARGESGAGDTLNQGTSAGQLPQSANFSAHPGQIAPFRIDTAAARDAGAIPATAAPPADAQATPAPLPTADVAVQLQSNNRLNIELATHDRALALRLDAASDQLIADLRQVGSEVEAVRVELRSGLTPEQSGRNDQQTSRQPDQSDEAHERHERHGEHATDGSDARKTSAEQGGRGTELRLATVAAASIGNVDRFA